MCYWHPLIFQHTTHISHIPFQHTFPSTLSPLFHDHPEISTHFLNLCWNFQHKTYSSDSLFQHTILQTKKECFRTPSRSHFTDSIRSTSHPAVPIVFCGLTINPHIITPVHLTLLIYLAILEYSLDYKNLLMLLHRIYQL